MDLISQSALRVASLIWRPGHGGIAFTVVCKATFSLQAELSPLAPSQEPVVQADRAASDGSLLAATELVPLKKRPEVLVTGHAHAPEGRLVTSLTARVAIGEIDKTLQITGDRAFSMEGRLGDPAPFSKMPLSWDLAAGGPDTSNPVGKPLGASAKADFFGRTPAPNLLPAGLFLTSRNDVVQPVGLGPIAPGWPSRTACLHRHAASWDAARWHEAPLPADIDLGYFNAAPADQQRAAPFGDEQIYLENLHPSIPSLSTRLAPVTPSATVDLGAGPQPLNLRCDTLIIDTDRSLVMLVWRGHTLLERPDQPGKIVVSGPGRPVQLPGWVSDAAPPSDRTMVPGFSALPSRDLPFAGPAAGPPSGVPATAHPSAPPPSFLPPGTGGGPASAPGDPGSRGSDAAAGSQHRLPRFGEMTLPADAKVDVTLPPGQMRALSVLPFGGPESASAEPPRFDAVPSLSADPTVLLGRPPAAQTLVAPAQIAHTPHPTPFSQQPGLPPPPAAQAAYPAPITPAAAYSPPPAPQGAYPPPSAPQGAYPPPSAPQGAYPPPSAPQDVYPPPAISPAAYPLPLAPLSALAPPDEPPPRREETPTPPELFGAPGLDLRDPDGAPDTAASPTPQPDVPAAEGQSAEQPPSPALDLGAYPPARCGAIAARLGLEEAAEEVFREESLDAERWERVHEHWLDRIDAEVAKGRAQLQAEYDAAYVGAIESDRGALTPDTYAALAEAAERDAVEEELQARKLPEDAWSPIHRVWLGRLLGDLKLARDVRARIAAIRAALP